MQREELTAWLDEVGMLQQEGGSHVASHRGLGRVGGGWDWRDGTLPFRLE